VVGRGSGGAVALPSGRNHAVKATFLTAISQVTLPGSLGRGIRLSDTAFVTNDWHSVASLLPQEFPTQVGLLEWKFLQGAKVWVHTTDEIPENNGLLPYLTQQLRQVALLLNHLWLQRDNSATCETGFAFAKEGPGTHFASNFLALRYSMADGRKDGTTSFSPDEVRQARELFERLSLPAEGADHGLASLSRVEERIERALYFVQAARAQTDLGLKLGHYCTALEALFATAITELAHQLSERTAAFLETGPAERLTVYGTCKRAYKLRSQAFHGAKLDVRDARGLSVAMDEYLRRILGEVFSHDAVFELFRMRSDTFERNLVALVLGTPKEALLAAGGAESD
jgi:hypothetical protein